MGFDIDMKSDHKERFQETRKLLLAFDGFMETKKDGITTYLNDRAEHVI